jgi:hypothetical protein
MGRGGITPLFLTPGLNGGQSTASPRFCPEETGPDSYWIGGWVGPRTCVGFCGEEDNIFPLPGLEHFENIYL